jgi:hypothetical protein
MWPIPEFPSELTTICAFEHPGTEADGGVETLVAGGAGVVAGTVVTGTVVVTAAAVVVELPSLGAVVVDEGSVDDAVEAAEPE